MELNDPILVHWIDTDVIVRIGLAAIVGLLLGLDREVRGRAAGLRTHGLICVSAATMTVAMIALFNQIGNDRADVLRIFEATGAFIGIVGAGLIVFSKGKVKNLTTAAHVWLTAVIGIACGAGLWPLVLAGSIVSIVMLTALGMLARKFWPDEDFTR